MSWPTWMLWFVGFCAWLFVHVGATTVGRVAPHRFVEPYRQLYGSRSAIPSGRTNTHLLQQPRELGEEGVVMRLCDKVQMRRSIKACCV